MKTYNHELIGTLGVDDHSEGPAVKLSIGVGVGSDGTCVISFGTKYSIRIPEDDVFALRDLLHDAGRKLEIARQLELTSETEELRRRRYLDLAQCSEV